jgi:cytochrome aa3-600 menaquinol oxidase subunit 3
MSSNRVLRILDVAVRTTSASDIGQLYIFLGLVSLIIGSINAFIIRYQLTYNTVGAVGYYDAVTLHGIFMIFFVVMPLSVGFANYLIPRMIGAYDLYWPRINALSFWILPPAVLLAAISPWFGPVNTGWYMYTPLSVDLNTNPGIGVNLLEIALILSGLSSTLTGVNFIMTIVKMKKVPYFKMPLFVWAFFATAILLIIAMPPLTGGLVMAFLDRAWETPFFNPALGGSPVLWQHLFWFFGHPEVYILVLPAMGLVSEILPRMAGRPIYGYKTVALSSMAIAFFSAFSVWMHHMFTAIANEPIRILAASLTMAIAIPSGIKVFNWTATMYDGQIRVTAPFLLSLSFVILFLLGGITGVFFPLIPLDYALNGTYFVVGHFHYVVFAILVALLAGVVYYFPYLTGRKYDEELAKSGSILILAGSLLLATGMTLAGVLGLPRRYAQDPSIIYQPFQFMANVGGIFIGLGLILLLGTLVYAWIKGQRVTSVDPWEVESIGMPDFYIKPIKLPLSLGKSIDGSEDEHYHGFPYYSLLGIFTAFVPLGFQAFFLGLIPLGFLFLLSFMGLGIAWLYSQWFKGITPTTPPKVMFDGAGIPNASSQESLGIITLKDTRTAVLLFIVAEIFLFGSFIGGYLFVASPLTNPLAYVNAKPYELEILPLPAIMTAILLSSSIPAHLAYEYMKKGNVKLFRILGIVTSLMGLTFLMGQVYEFTHIINFLPQTSAFAAFFYSTVNLHAFHVIMGLVVWSVVLGRAFKGVLPYGGSVAASYYWHFVDGVWVVVFSTFYLHLFS